MLYTKVDRDPDYDKVIAYYQSQKWEWTQKMTIIPVHFCLFLSKGAHIRLLSVEALQIGISTFS
jgi:hypothetical protein